ncbi:MAG: polysaccharide ABC transporter ATP-binding protein [Pyrinomonadaceae bacterium]
MSVPRIELRNLTKIYPTQLADFAISVGSALSGRKSADNSLQKSGKTAVDDVSLLIETGERVGIVGRNGAGKSTLLHMIAGLAEPTSGRVQVSGNVTSIMTLGVGLREDLSGRENIYIDGELQGKTRDEIDCVIGDVIAFADLGEFIDYPIRTYSTGMKSRLAFAMIAYIDPEILIIDEALSAGDARFSAKATRRIREICNKGKIVIIVSHSMQSVREMCNRCLWMENGRVVTDGGTDEVIRAYIDSVRAQDEEALLESFQSYVGEELYRDEYRITNLAAFLLEDKKSRGVFESGENLKLRVELALTGELMNADLRLLVKRLDGLVVADHYASECAPMLLANMYGQLEFEIGWAPLNLNYGTYVVAVELWSGEQLLARRSIIVKVVAVNTPAGGRPVLLYPSTVRSLALS